MTNLENIEKNPEVLAKIIAYEDACDCCCNRKICDTGEVPETTCDKGILKWLKQEISTK